MGTNRVSTSWAVAYRPKTRSDELAPPTAFYKETVLGFHSWVGRTKAKRYPNRRAALFDIRKYGLRGVAEELTRK